MTTANYTCGHCRTLTASAQTGSSNVFHGSQPGQQKYEAVYRCAACGRLTICVDDDEQYPPFVEAPSLSPEELRSPVSVVWREVLLCNQVGAPMATAAMLRTLIVAVYYHLNPDQKEKEEEQARKDGKKRWSVGFEEALKSLEKSEDLTKRLRARADTLKDLGHKAVHETKAPDPEKLAQALETAELWLKVLYIDVPESDSPHEKG